MGALGTDPHEVGHSVLFPGITVTPGNIPWLIGSDGTVYGTTPGASPSSTGGQTTSNTPTSTQTRPRTVGNSNSGTSIWDRLTPIIGAGLTVLNNYVVTRPGANPVAVAQLSNGQQYQQQLTQAQLQQLAAQQQGTFASAGADSSGLQIGGMTISWPMLAVVGVGIYLLQRPGYTRR
jgi:hypothetical protein